MEKEITLRLRENNKLVTLYPHEINIKGQVINIHQLDLTDIFTKDELILYVNNLAKERKAIKWSIPRLTDNLHINNVELHPNRFNPYDATAVSACTNMFYEHWNEDIFLEFKFRDDIAADRYPSIILDETKYNELKQLHNKTNKRVFVNYIYMDGKIRFFELSKHWDDIDKIETRWVAKCQYRPHEKKKVNFLNWNNPKTLLI